MNKLDIKRGFTIVIFAFALAARAFSQDIYPWPDHIFPFCTDDNPYGITYESGVSGFAAFPSRDHMGCLGGTPGPIWYYMQIDYPGDLLIYIEQKSLLGVGLDVDFACWGPFQAESKTDFLQKLQNSYRLEISEHPNHRPENGDHSHDTGGYPFNNLVDCSYDPASTEWCYIPNAKTDEWYLLLITNFSRKHGKIHFERVDDKSTATTKCDITVPVTICPVPKELKQIDNRTSAICLDETRAKVTIDLECEDGFSLSSSSLRRTKVRIIADDRTYDAEYVDGHFECEIDITKDVTEYYAQVECPDPDFELETERHRIVRSEDCIHINPTPFVVRDTIRAGSLDIENLRRGDKPVVVDMSEQGTADNGPVNLEDFDLQVNYDDIFIEKVEINRNGNTLELTPKLRGDWCECFIPDSITINAILIPKVGQSSPIELPIKFGIIHKSAWLARCLWVCVTVLTLFLVFLYLLSLLKKNRFKKSAMMMAVYYDRYGGEVDDQGGLLLRKRGFTGWLARWFWPRDERNTLSFDTPNVPGVTFIAADSDNIVNVDKSTVDPSTMKTDNYNPQTDREPSKPFKLGANGTIEVHRTDGVKEGYISFSPGNERDGGGYRFFVSALMIADVIAMLALLYFLIKSLL